MIVGLVFVPIQFFKILVENLGWPVYLTGILLIVQFYELLTYPAS